MRKWKNLTQYRLNEEVAGELLREYYLQRSISPVIPVPIEDIAKRQFKFDCYISLSLKDNDIAAGVLDEASKAIYIDPNAKRQIARFTIAHELSHLKISSLAEDLRAILTGLAGGETAEAIYEIEELSVNRLAGAILMPSDDMLNALKENRQLTRYAFISIARRFNVSVDACFVRLLHLSEGNNEFENYFSDIHELKRNLPEIRALYEVLAKNSPDGISFARDWLKEYRSGRGKKPVINQSVKYVNDIFLAMGVFSEARHKNLEIKNSPREALGRPFIIEFAGTPNAGKQAQIEIMVDYLRTAKNMRVKVNEDPFRICPVRDSHSQKLLWVWSYVVQKALEATTLDQYDVVIFDRGLFDTLAQIKLYSSQKHLTKKVMRALNSTSNVRELISLFDIVFLMEIPPEISIIREKEFPNSILGSLTETYGQNNRAVINQNLGNPRGLELLNHFYNLTYKEYENRFSYIHRISDNGDAGKTSISTKIAGQLVDYFPVARRKLSIPLIKNGTNSNQPSLPGFETDI